MVKVWYQPPPYGPRTSLNRPSYGNGGDIGPKWVVRISKMPPGRVITGFIAAFATIAYIPLSKFGSVRCGIWSRTGSTYFLRRRRVY